MLENSKDFDQFVKNSNLWKVIFAKNIGRSYGLYQNRSSFKCFEL